MTSGPADLAGAKSQCDADKHQTLLLRSHMHHSRRRKLFARDLNMRVAFVDINVVVHVAVNASVEGIASEAVADEVVVLSAGLIHVKTRRQ